LRAKSNSVLQFSLHECDHFLPAVVREYRAEYRWLDNILQDNPKILDAIHLDLENLSMSKGGRSSNFSSANLFRALVVKQKEGITYRDACIRISESARSLGK
jgi:hypothetical protein